MIFDVAPDTLRESVWRRVQSDTWVRGLCTHTDKYSPHGTVWSTRYYNEDDYAMYPDLTDRQRAILKPPSAHLWFPNGDPAGRPQEPYGRGRSRPDSRATTARI